MRTVAAFLLFTVLALGQSLPHPQQYRQTEYHTMDCEQMTDPVPVNTPAPLLSTNGSLVVSFIIGYDGNAYSPLLLTENGNRHDTHEMLRIVRTWRYHPATCNGVPTEAEAVFNIHQ
jgi:hypothetical protein